MNSITITNPIEKLYSQYFNPIFNSISVISPSKTSSSTLRLYRYGNCLIEFKMSQFEDVKNVLSTILKDNFNVTVELFNEHGNIFSLPTLLKQLNVPHDFELDLDEYHIQIKEIQKLEEWFKNLYLNTLVSKWIKSIEANAYSIKGDITIEDIKAVLHRFNSMFYEFGLVYVEEAFDEFMIAITETKPFTSQPIIKIDFPFSEDEMKNIDLLTIVNKME